MKRGTGRSNFLPLLAILLAVVFHYIGQTILASAMLLLLLPGFVIYCLIQMSGEIAPEEPGGETNSC